MSTPKMPGLSPARRNSSQFACGQVLDGLLADYHPKCLSCRAFQGILCSQILTCDLCLKWDPPLWDSYHSKLQHLLCEEGSLLGVLSHIKMGPSSPLQIGLLRVQPVPLPALFQKGRKVCSCTPQRRLLAIYIPHRLKVISQFHLADNKATRLLTTAGTQLSNQPSITDCDS